MEQKPRIVAELGRPETPEETAARKAESSRIYRSSQNTRNLVAALLVTLAVVAVIILAVPRGAPPETGPIDVAAVAQDVEEAEGRTVLVPDVPDEWIVNRASVEGDSVSAWTIVYVPDESEGFVNIAQGFDADPAWATRILGGASAPTAPSRSTASSGTCTAFPTRPAPATSRRALGTSAGDDIVLVYGFTDDETLERAAASVTDQIVALRAQSAGDAPSEEAP